MSCIIYADSSKESNSQLPKNVMFSDPYGTVFQPIIILGKLCGLVRWDFNVQFLSEEDHREWWKRWLSYAYVIAYHCLMIWSYEKCYDFIITFLEGNLTDEIVGHLMMLSYFGFRLLVTIICFWKTRKLKMFLKAVIQINSFLATRRCKMRYWASVLFVNSFMFFAVVFLILTVFYDLKEPLNVKLGISIMFIGYLIMEVHADMMFKVAADFCSHSFKLNTDQLTTVLSSGAIGITHKLQKLRCEYESSCLLAFSFQETFGSLLALDVSSSTIKGCFSAYNLLFWGKLFPGSTYIKIAFGTFFAAFLFRIYMLTCAADNITKQAAAGLKPLHNAKTVQLNAAERFEIMLFISKLSQSPVEITACGFFAISKKLFTTIVSMTATYLVILAQFHTDDTSHHSYNITHPANGSANSAINNSFT